jgi:hypothetical protein
MPPLRLSQFTFPYHSNPDRASGIRKGMVRLGVALQHLLLLLGSLNSRLSG